MKRMLLIVATVVLCCALAGCTVMVQNASDESSSSSSATTSSNSSNSSGSSASSGSNSSSSSSNPTSMPSFSSVDLEGNAVTNEIFQNARVTVVNFWGTYCSPCINEMPDLADWSDQLADDGQDVQIVGVVTDVASTESADYQTAINICNQTGVTYTNILANDDWNSMCSTLIGVPTTYLVSRNGTIIGEPIIGAYMDKYQQALEDYFAEEEA